MVDIASLGPAARAQVEATLGKVKAKRRYEEENLQIKVVETILAPLEGLGRLTFFHVPNGGRRTKAEAGILKAMGVRPGIGDLWILKPDGLSFVIEMKYGKGKESEDQITTAGRLLRFKVPTYTCWSINDVWAVIAREGCCSGIQQGAVTTWQKFGGKTEAGARKS